METTTLYRVYIGITEKENGKENGQENGNYYSYTGVI